MPHVTITIQLKETYIADSGSESKSRFDSNTVGMTQKIGVSVAKAPTDYDVKLTAATLELSNALANASD